MTWQAQNVPQMLQGVEVRASSWPWYCVYGIVPETLANSMGSMRSSIVVHEDRSACKIVVVKMRHHMSIQNLILVSLSIKIPRNDDQIKLAVKGTATSHHDTTSSKGYPLLDVSLVICCSS